MLNAFVFWILSYIRLETYFHLRQVASRFENSHFSSDKNQIKFAAKTRVYSRIYADAICWN
jgi:hypothetical protein